MNRAGDYLIDADYETVADVTAPLFGFERRASILRRLLPATRDDLNQAIKEGWPSMYGGTTNGRTVGIHRDLKKMGARCDVLGEWRLSARGGAR